MHENLQEKDRDNEPDHEVKTKGVLLLGRVKAEAVDMEDEEAGRIRDPESAVEGEDYDDDDVSDGSFTKVDKVSLHADP
jgi:hypothetical protein